MSDIRFNQWLHQSGTGGVSQVDGGHVGIGTTNPDIAVHTANTKKINVGIVTANSVYAGAYYGDGSNLTGLASDKIEEGDTKVEVVDSGSQYIVAEVNGSEKIRIKSTGQIVLGSDGTNSELTFSQDGSTGVILNSTTTGFGGYNTFTVNSAQFVHKYGGNERLRIDSNGRLLLRTTTEGHPAADELTIENTANAADMGITLRSATNGQGAIYFSDGTSGADEYRGIINYNHTNNFFSFFTDASERLRIDSSGKIGINRTATDHPLEIQHASEPTVSLWRGSTRGAGLQAQSGGTYLYSYQNAPIIFSVNSANGFSERVRINTDGDLKVGTTGNSGAKIQIGNHTFAGTDFAYNNDRVGFQNNGSLTCISNCSTYNDGVHPGYGIVLVQGPNTSSYNTWGICPDGPSKGNSLNLHYGAQATNIHSPSHQKFEFTGNGQFLKPLNPAFRARSSSGGWKSFGNTNFNKMPFNAEDFDNGSHYNTTTYQFVVPVSGKYYFYCQMQHDGSTTNGGTSGQMQIVVQGVAVIAYGKSGRQGEVVNCGTVWSCTAGNVVYCEGRTNITNGDDWHGDSYYSYFTGYLIG